MKKFFILCLMASIVSFSANAQYKNAIYETNRTTSADYEKEIVDINSYALKNGDTFHFEYNTEMYMKGAENVRIGYNILAYSNLCYATFSGSILLAISDREDRYAPLIVSSCIVGICDIVGLCYIANGHKKMKNSAMMISPTGVRIVF